MELFVEGGMQIILCGFLITMAFIDKRTKQIPIMPLLGLSIVFVVCNFILEKGIFEWLSGIVIGIVLLVVSIITSGRIGAGDALVYVLTGIVLGIYKNLELLILALFFASIASAILIFVKHVGKNYRIPFLPFTALAYGVVIFI